MKEVTAIDCSLDNVDERFAEHLDEVARRERILVMTAMLPVMLSVVVASLILG